MCIGSTNLNFFNINSNSCEYLYSSKYSELKIIVYLKSATILSRKDMSRAFSDTKPHYEILDALRGVAALMVVWYHICEGYSFAGRASIIQRLNHGYLAVDFFFILSGFVLSYAYDDRWRKGFTVKNFFKRRLIRLHPMVIMGALIGAAAFLVQGSVQWNGTEKCSPSTGHPGRSFSSTSAISSMLC